MTTLAKMTPKPRVGQRAGRQRQDSVFTLDALRGAVSVGSTRSNDWDARTWLATPLRVREMQQMSLNPTLALAKMVVCAPIKSGPWSLQVDEEAPEGAEALIRESIDAEELRFLVREACRAMEYGFQSLEEVWEMSATTWLIRKFKPLLPELTTPLVVESTGDFAGVRQRGVNGQQIELTAEECLHFTYGQEGDNYRGRSRHEAARIPFRAWNRLAARMDDLARKVSGVMPIMRYPQGTALDKDNNEIDNGEIAQRVVQRLADMSGVTFPATIAPWAADLIRAGADPEKLYAWTLSFADTKGTQGNGVVESMRYWDSQLMRAWLAPERAAIEGQSGTKAEAETHGEIVIASADEFRSDIARCVNYHAVDRLMRYNFGEASVGTVRWVPQPLADEAQSRIRQLVASLAQGQFTMQSIMQVLDVDAMIESAGLPVRTDENGEPIKFQPPAPYTAPVGGDPLADPLADPLGGGANPPAGEGAGSVQDTALNGAQVQAAVDIAVKVATGELAAEAAVAMIVAFFRIDETTARAIVTAQAGQASAVQARQDAERQAKAGNGPQLNLALDPEQSRIVIDISSRVAYGDIEPEAAVRLLIEAADMDETTARAIVKGQVAIFNRREELRLNYGYPRPWGMFLNEGGGGEEDPGPGGGEATPQAVLSRVLQGILAANAAVHILTRVFKMPRKKAVALVRLQVSARKKKQAAQEIDSDSPLTSQLAAIFNTANRLLS